MRACKSCRKDFEPRIGYNGIRASRCDTCLLAHKREKQRQYLQRSKERHKQKTRKTEKTLPELIKLADLVFSRYIRKRDKGKCFTCGTIRPWKQQQNGHYIPRDCKPLRYDEQNCNTQCKECNEYGNGELEIYRQNLVAKYGEDAVLALEAQRTHIKQYTREELYMIINNYDV